MEKPKVWCKDCLEFYECKIMREAREIMEKHRREKERARQPRLGEDPSELLKNWKARTPIRRKERGEIRRKQFRCFNKRFFQAVQLGIERFHNQSEWNITDCDFCVHYKPKEEENLFSTDFKGVCSLGRKPKYKRGFCKYFKTRGQT